MCSHEFTSAHDALHATFLPLGANMRFQVTYVVCRRDPDAFVAGSHLQPYQLTQPIRPDAALSSLLHEHCAAAVGSGKALQGLNVTADSFYSSQVC